MEPKKKAHLEAAGWKIGDYGDFLGLSESERQMVELRLAVSRAIRTKRQASGITQQQLAKMMKSSQPRVHRMETGASDVSLDLMFAGLFAIGGSVSDVVEAIPGRRSKSASARAAKEIVGQRAKSRAAKGSKEAKAAPRSKV